MRSRPDVLIAGAGPTGLTLACGLLAAGVAVHVTDRAVGPARTSRALGLQPRGAEVLDRLGALGDLPRRSIGVRNVAVHVDRRLVGTLRIGDHPALTTRTALLVSQAEIEAELRRRVADLGGSVHWGAGLAHAEQDEHGVRSVLGDGTTVRSDWLVGCDGAHSQVRKSAGIGFPGAALVEHFLLADAHANLPLPRDTVSTWLQGSNLVGAFPLPGDDLWRLMAPAPEAAKDDWPVLELLAALLEEYTGFSAARVHSAEWTSSFRFHRRLADTYRRGRVLLAGDAAHIHSPFGGQGMNTGIGDAENLAWKLALVCAGRADPELLDSYEAERRPIATEVLASTSGVTRLVLADTRLARLLRDRIAVPLMNRTWVQRLAWERASQLKVSYRDGPFGPPGGRRRPLRRPRPGDRVGDLACLREDGSTTRLHAELGARWVLLASEPSASSECAAVARKHLGRKAVTVLVPRVRQVADIMLVRPDAHLGWCGAAAVAELDEWLASVLRSGQRSGGR